jgi:hypothetical protein
MFIFLTGRNVLARDLMRHFQIHSLVPAAEADEMFGLLGDSEREGLVLEHVGGQEANTPNKRAKKRKVQDDAATTAQPVKQQLTNITNRTAEADKENLPPSTCQTPVRMNTPAHLGTPGYQRTPARLGTPAYMLSPGGLLTPDHQIDFDGFDNFDMGGDWNPPTLEDDPMSSPHPASVHNIPTPKAANRRNLTLASTMSGNTSSELSQTEVMLDGETTEAFEERVLNKRAGYLNAILKKSLKSEERMAFSKLAAKNLRKEAAQKFYSLLVLQKVAAVNVDQECDNGEIYVTRGGRFETAVF